MSSAQDWDESFDFVIVGSGGASMCAALVAKTLGKRPLIIEKGRRLDRLLRWGLVDS
jgi:3-oxosteroid 1-dehydrogenase